MGFINKIVVTIGVGALLGATQTFAQVPQDNEFVKAYPYFAKVDRGDVSPEQKEKWVKDLKDTSINWREEDMAQIYGQLTSGPMPRGFFKGHPIKPADSGITTFEKLGYPVDVDQIKSWVDFLWQGKYFDPTLKYAKNRVLCEQVPTFTKMQRLLAFMQGKSLTITCGKGGEGIARRDLRFATKVFCGQSLLDGRRESIVLDYAYGDDIRAKHSELWDRSDFLATRAGLTIRDEIRMVREGFYLGRAYMKGFFVTWFTLDYDPTETAAADVAIPGATEDACWVGYQRQRNRIEATGAGGYSAYTNKGTLR